MKNYFWNWAGFLMAGALVLGMVATAGAQEPQQTPQNDPGAARISYLHGDVSTQHSDSSDWVAATLNTPVVSGDHVSTAQDARAEIQLDHANILRMSGQTTANVVSLTRNQMQVQVGQGLVNYDVLRNNDSGAEIDTPNVAIRPQMGEGSYRILVNSDNETIVDVRRGSAQISTPQGSTIVQHDQRITIQGNADNAQYQVSGAPSRDDWDRWNGDRDNVIEKADSWRHTNPNYTGTQDLDAYGNWRYVPDYGDVWFPDDGPGWVPYRDGRWVYEPYYGWTWVSYEPWGWAPYHYGRWFVYGGNWGWWPGPVYAGYYPVWAPAYVSFFGFGGGGWGFGFGFGFGGGYGNIGWLPCGPGDRFFPWYGRGVTNVNVVNVTNINNINNINTIHNNFNGGMNPLRGGPHAFSNIQQASSDPRVRGGISSMKGSEFGHGRVPTQQSRIDAGSFQKASLMTGAHPVSPSHESFHPTDRQAAPSSIPNRASNNQRFFSTNARTNGSPQAGNGSGNPNHGGNFGGAPAHQNSAQPGSHGLAQTNSPNVNRGPTSSPSSAQPGFHSFGQTNNGNVNRSPGASPSPAQPGSHGFGPTNNGNVNRGTAPSPNSGQRGFNAPSSQQSQSIQSSRPGWRTFTPPSGQPQSNGGGRTFGGQSGGSQPRPNFSQPSQSPQQYQGNARGGFNNSGSGRPSLNMQQPVVTPRGGGSYSGRGPSSGGYYGGFGGNRGGPSGGGSYSGRPMPSAPSGGGNGGGGYHGGGPSGGGGFHGGSSGGAPSGGGSHGGFSAGGSSGGGGSHGGSSGGGGQSSSGRGHH
jgi:uncharacterized protein DUF6600/FecR-like protein